jgi:uncharacterized membrane protein
MIKKISLIVLTVFYIVAGINHFVHPTGYLKIIPDYLPAHQLLNYLAGACEMAFGALLIFPRTRNAGIALLILMLAAFMPVHIAMLQQAPMRLGPWHITPAIAWIRILLQPVLMLWLAWHWQTKRTGNV